MPSDQLFLSQRRILLKEERIRRQGNGASERLSIIHSNPAGIIRHSFGRFSSKEAASNEKMKNSQNRTSLFSLKFNLTELSHKRGIGCSTAAELKPRNLNVRDSNPSRCFFLSITATQQDIP